MSLTNRGLRANGAIGENPSSAHGRFRISPVYLRNVEGGAHMNLLKATGVLGLAGSLVLAGHIADASAQSTSAGLAITPVSDAALTAPVRTVYGTVKSLSRHVLTLDVGGRDMRFIVDDNTGVLAKDTRKTLSRGDMARVGYRELNGAMRAVEIQVKGRIIISSR